VLARISRKERRVVRRVFDIMKPGRVWRIIANALDELLKYDEERLAIGRLEGFANLWQQATQVKHHESLIRRCFGESIPDGDVEQFGKLCGFLEESGVREPTDAFF
jgi:hypothetical protein